MATLRKQAFNTVAEEKAAMIAAASDSKSGGSSSGSGDAVGPRGKAFNTKMEAGTPNKFRGEFPIPYEYEDWFRDYLREIGFSSDGKAQTKNLKSRWRPGEFDYRTEDNRLIIRPSYKIRGTDLPNFINTTINFQLFWDEHALRNAKSNINVLSFDHFLELVVWPSRDYHDPLKVNEVFAPTAYNS